VDERVLNMIGALEGQRLWGRGRAVEMEMFQFGDRVTHELRGKVRTVGEWALHLTGGWRIAANGRVLVGYRDYWIPPIGVPDDDFDPNAVGRSRRDELMDRFVAHGEDAHRVESATISEHADLRLVLADGCVLEAFTDLGFIETADQDTNECWRLFQPATELPHLVVGPGGLIEYEQ
jgi:hypothetical protein